MVTKKYVGRAVYLTNRDAEIIYCAVSTRFPDTTEIDFTEEEIQRVMLKFGWCKFTAPDEED